MRVLFRIRGALLPRQPIEALRAWHSACQDQLPIVGDEIKLEYIEICRRAELQIHGPCHRPRSDVRTIRRERRGGRSVDPFYVARHHKNLQSINPGISVYSIGNYYVYQSANCETRSRFKRYWKQIEEVIENSLSRGLVNFGFVV